MSAVAVESSRAKCPELGKACIPKANACSDLLFKLHWAAEYLNATRRFCRSISDTECSEPKLVYSLPIEIGLLPLAKALAGAEPATPVRDNLDALV